MPSLGELFISLGFDVDDAKLKNFKSQLSDTNEGMIRLGTTAGGTLAGLTLFVQRASEGAVALGNMASQWGANVQGAQTFANVLHQINPAVSIPGGQGIYRNFAEMINAKVPVGSGAYGALSLLGVTNPWADPETVWQEIRHNLPGLMHTLGLTADKQRARASDLLAQAMLPGALGAALESDSQYNAASKYNIQPSVLDNLSKFAKATAEFDEAMNKFSTDMAGELAEKLVKVVEFLTSALNVIDSYNTAHPGMAIAEGVAAGSVGALSIGKLISLFRVGKSAAAAGGAEVTVDAKMVAEAMWAAATKSGPAGWLFALPPLAGAAATFGAGWAGGKLGSYLNSGGSSSGGFTDVQKRGILRALYDESKFDPNAVGDHGAAYGIAQWHPDRQRNFRLWSGHDIHGSSREEQLAFVNFELTQGLERAAGQRIAQASTEQQAYLMAKKYYERPAGASKIDINIYSNSADPHEVAKLVDQRFQQTINNTNAQTNLGAAQ